jgi:hypothetical protein
VKGKGLLYFAGNLFVSTTSSADKQSLIGSQISIFAGSPAASPKGFPHPSFPADVNFMNGGMPLSGKLQEVHSRAEGCHIQL